MHADTHQFADQPPDANSADLTELRAEMWILLPGAQVLTAFLILLPFNGGFAEVGGEGRPVYIITFVCSMLSLLLFTAPAAHHCVHRPLLDRKDYKVLSNRFMLAGLAALSVASILVAQLVLSAVVPWGWLSWTGAAIVAMLILGLWWLVPGRRRVITAEQ